MNKAGDADRERALRAIAAVPLPAADPVAGVNGPVIVRWRDAKPA